MCVYYKDYCSTSEYICCRMDPNFSRLVVGGNLRRSRGRGEVSGRSTRWHLAEPATCCRSGCRFSQCSPSNRFGEPPRPFALLSPPSHVSCSPQCVRESPDASATRARWQPGRQQAPPLLFKMQQAVPQPSLQPLRPMTTSFPPRPSITTTSQLLQGAMPPPISGAGMEGKRHKAAWILQSPLYSEFNKGNILRHLLIRIGGSSSWRTLMPRPLRIASPGAREFRCLRSCAWAPLSPFARTQARAHSNPRKRACHTGLVHAGVICLQHFVYACVCVPV